MRNFSRDTLRGAIVAAGSTILLAGLAGCATPLSSYQQQELTGYEAKGLAVQVKNPGTAAGLGLLPGGGSFYTRHYGLGVANLLTWPISILWDPVSGYDGAEVLNYAATKARVDSERDKEITALDDALAAGNLTTQQYMAKKHTVERKYSPN